MLHALLISLSIHGTAVAKPEDTVGRQLEQIQGKMKFNSAEDCLDCEVRRAGHDEPLWSQCFKELCPDGYGGVWEEMGKADVSIIDARDPDFHAALKEMGQQVVAARLKAVQELRRAIKSGRMIEDTAARRLLRFNRLNMATLPFSAQGAPAMRDMSRAVRKIQETGPLEDAFDTVSQSKTPAELAELMTQGRAALARIDKEIRDKTGVRDFHNDLILSDENAPATAENYDRLRANLRTTRMTKYIIESPKFDLPGRVSVREMFGPRDAELARQEILLKSYVGKDSDSRHDLIASALDQGAENCTSAFYLNRQFAPTSEQAESLRKDLPKMTSDFVDSMKPHLSEESSGRLSEASKNWKFNVPGDARTQKSNFLGSLAKTSKLNRDFAHEPTNVSGPSADYLFVSRYTDSIQPDAAIASEMTKACAAFAIEPIRDSYTMGKKKMEIGPYSMTRRAFGQAVFNHELGHATSDLFSGNTMSAKSKAWFTRVRQCLGSVPGHADTVEEDWADFASNLSVTHNQACHFLRESDSEMTVKHRPNDNHSGTLYRALSINQARGRTTPRVCTEALRKKGEAFESKDCLSKGKLANAEK